MMDRYELQKLRDLPIEGVAERLGMHVVRHKCLCPFHDDHHASLSFNMRKNTFRCFVCDAHGGTIDLVMRHLRMDFKEACRWLADGGLSLTLPQREGNGNWQKPKENRFDASRYTRFFEHPWLSDAARRFLFEERRIDRRVVSWCRITSWRDKEGTEWLQTPYYDMDGKLIGIQNRNLNPSKSQQTVQSQQTTQASPLGGGMEGAIPRFKFPYGSQCGIYNLPVLKLLRPGEELWITEGCSDCWAMLSSGKKAIAIPSATLLSVKDKAMLSQLATAGSYTYHMYPDRDAPGERLFLQLKDILPSIVHHQLPQDCKDFSDYYVRYLCGG